MGIRPYIVMGPGKQSVQDETAASVSGVGPAVSRTGN